MIAPFDTPAAFEGLDAFSHIWITWQFHHNDIKRHTVSTLTSDKTSIQFRAQVRPPRLGGNQKIGVFASRSMYRPSNLGLSVVKLERVEILEGRVLLIIRGADMVDGTPIIDIKPYVSYSDALIDTASGFAPAAPSVAMVTITALASEQFRQMIDKRSADNSAKTTLITLIAEVQERLIEADIEHIRALIAQDPRPAYRQDEKHKVFVMRYKGVDIHFWQIEPYHLEITKVTRITV